MPHTSRLVLGLAVVVGLSHLVPTALDWSGPAIVVWKGAGVVLLAVYAALQARRLDGWLLASVMAAGAAGDVLIEVSTFEAGAGGFALGHLAAIVLYLRCPRRLPWVWRLVGLAVVVAASVAIRSAGSSIPVTVYVVLLLTMAVSALLSRFPLGLTGLGAVMFVVSDGLIFLRSGPLQGSIPAAVATWAIYFVGQVLITVGVTRTLGAASVVPVSDPASRRTTVR